MKRLNIIFLALSMLSLGCAPESSDCGLLCAEEKEKEELPSDGNTLAFEFIGDDFSVTRHRVISVPVGLSGDGQSETNVTLGVDFSASTSITDLDDFTFKVGKDSFAHDELELTFIRPGPTSTKTIEIEFPSDMTGTHNISLALFYTSPPSEGTPPIGGMDQLNIVIEIDESSTEPDPDPLTIVSPRESPVRVPYPRDTDYYSERSSDVTIELEGGDGNYNVVNNCPYPLIGCGHGYYGEVYSTTRSNVFVYRPYIISDSEYLECVHPFVRRCPMPRSAYERVQVYSNGESVTLEIYTERDWGY